LVRQRVELTKVAEYPAAAVQIAISLIAVVLLLLSTANVVGTKIPKNVAYVQKDMVLPILEFLFILMITFLIDITKNQYH
jgi:hypothetical protein